MGSTGSGWKAAVRPVLRTCVPVALLLLLARVIDVRAALELLRGARVEWIAAGLLLVQLQIVASALRWRWTAARLGQRIGARRAMAEYYLASLVNQTLPGGVTGDAARAIRNAGGTSLGTAGLAVFAERVSGQAALFAVTLVGLACWPALVVGDRPASSVRAVALVGVGVAASILLVRVAGRRGPARVRQAMSRLRAALHLAWVADGAWLVQGAASLAIVAGYLALYAACGLALGAPLPMSALVTVVPLALLTMLLPVSIGGWGLREAASAALWPLVGLTAESGLATSVLYGLVALAGSLPGLYVAASRRQRAQA